MEVWTLVVGIYTWGHRSQSITKPWRPRHYLRVIITSQRFGSLATWSDFSTCLDSWYPSCSGVWQLQNIFIPFWVSDIWTPVSTPDPAVEPQGCLLNNPGQWSLEPLLHFTVKTAWLGSLGWQTHRPCLRGRSIVIVSTRYWASVLGSFSFLLLDNCGVRIVWISRETQFQNQTDPHSNPSYSTRIGEIIALFRGS